MIRHSVVVPVYNSAISLQQLYDRLVVVMEAMNAPFELVFVDDCSTDRSWPVLSHIAHLDSRVIALRLTNNAGQSQATLIGLKQASGDLLITLDDDLQHPPEEIPRLLAALKGPDAFDAIHGVPISRRGAPWRSASSWAFNFLLSLILCKPLRLRNSGFRALRRSLVERLPRVARPAPNISTLLFQVTPRIGVVRVTHLDSALPASRYSLGKLVRLSFDTVRSLPGRRRLLVFLIAASAGAFLLALAAAASTLGGFSNLVFASLVFALGLLLLGLGFAVAVAHLSALDIRRRPLAPLVVARLIRDRRENAVNDCPAAGKSGP